MKFFFSTDDILNAFAAVLIASLLNNLRINLVFLIKPTIVNFGHAVNFVYQQRQFWIIMF